MRSSVLTRAYTAGLIARPRGTSSTDVRRRSRGREPRFWGARQQPAAACTARWRPETGWDHRTADLPHRSRRLSRVPHGARPAHGPVVLGLARSEAPIEEGAHHVITTRWCWLRDAASQHPWACLFDERLVGTATANEWAEQVWGCGLEEAAEQGAGRAGCQTGHALERPLAPSWRVCVTRSKQW